MTNTGGRGAEYVVGEGNRWHREAVIATDPRYRKRNRGLVAWAAQKLGMGAPGFAIGGIPNPVEGVGDAIGGGVRAVGGAIRGAADRARDFMQDLSARALGPVRDAAKAMIDRLPGGERIQFLRDFGKNVVDRVYRWAAGKAEEGQKAMGGPGSNVGYRGGGGVERWRSTALQALRMTGSPASWIGSLLRRMNQESGGNPNAINNWDINAQRGDPSGGLMQNIRSAYASRVSGFPSLRGTNFLHPLGSIVASIVYANRRYGSAPRGWDRPGGYRNGGVVNVPGPTHPGEMVLRRGDQRQLLKLVRGRGPGGAEPRTVIHVGKLVVGGDTPGEVRRNAHIFMDVIEQRQIEHDARSA